MSLIFSRHSQAIDDAVTAYRRLLSELDADISIIAMASHLDHSELSSAPSNNPTSGIAETVKNNIGAAGMVDIPSFLVLAEGVPSRLKRTRLASSVSLVRRGEISVKHARRPQSKSSRTV